MQTTDETGPQPQVLAGPILRRVSPARIGLWLATRDDQVPTLALYVGDDGQAEQPTATIATQGHRRCFPLGEQVLIQMLDTDLSSCDIQALPSETRSATTCVGATHASG